jgi:colanic acid biosynthesis glycosyl transferase WcaI
MGHLGGGLLGRLGRAWERRVLTGFDRVITISSKMAERLAAKGVRPERLAVVRNWVDLELISPRPVSQAYRRELGLKASDFVVLYSGNLGAKQGVGLLAAAAERLADDPDVVFAIAGDGPMRGKLQAMAAELPNLKLLDFQPEARFGEFLSIADVHVLPQERDAADLLLPSKLGGMLASGRPVIVTAEPSTELGEFLAGACQLTPPGDAEALAAALRQAKAARPSPAQQAKRLALAATLAKDAGLAAFTAAALFLQGQARPDQPARAAA